MSAPLGLVIIPPGWVRSVFTNVGPTLDQIVPSGCRRGGQSRPVGGGTVEQIRRDDDGTSCRSASLPRSTASTDTRPAGARRGGAAAAQGLPGATRPAIDPFAAVIDGWLLADHDAPRKQR